MNPFVVWLSVAVVLEIVVLLVSGYRNDEEEAFFFTMVAVLWPVLVPALLVLASGWAIFSFGRGLGQR